MKKLEQRQRRGLFPPPTKKQRSVNLNNSVFDDEDTHAWMHGAFPPRWQSTPKEQPEMEALRSDCTDYSSIKLDHTTVGFTSFDPDSLLPSLSSDR